MAANEYYGNVQQPPPQTSNPSDIHDQHSWNNPHPNPPSSPSPIGGYSSPYDNRYSQYTAPSDHHYTSPGRLSENDQYADNIPLKPNAPQQGRPDWIDADTQYPPPNDPQNAAMNDSMNPPKEKRRKSKYFGKGMPWVTYLLSTVQVIVFIVEIVKNAQLTGSPIMTKPSFNPMIGPSPYVQINMGARYVSCMRNMENIQNSNVSVTFPCPNTTSLDVDAATNQCTLSELCGFNGVPNPKPNGSMDDKPEPNQWFRFILPMFLHAGVIHIGFNLFAQMSIGADMERTIGWWRYAIVYFSSGIFGFVLGANYAASGIASTGASGSLFGILALSLLDLIYKWKSKQRPLMELIIMIVTVAISFVLGLLPGLDNFSHIGGFLMGLVLGVSILRSPDTLRERIGTKTSYMSMNGDLSVDEQGKKFTKEPVGFFKGRKPLWWAWWLLRVGALVGIVAVVIVLFNNFYKYRTTCSWCKYLTCLPIKNWCDLGKLTTTASSSENARRGLLSSTSSVFGGRAFL